MERRRQIRRRYDGRFYGFRANCEQVPQLPASLVRAIVDDPRRIPYLLIWRREGEREIKEAVRVTHTKIPVLPSSYESVEVKRTDGSRWLVGLLWRNLPRGDGRALLLVCSACGTPCRALYAWRVGDDGRYYVMRRSNWECRMCSALRYSSE